MLAELVARDVFLHVGMKKTGTSYLQSILRASIDELRRQGLDLVPHHQPAGHRLAMAVLGRPTAGNPLTALPRQLEAAAGRRCLISQEKLGGAGWKKIAQLIPALEGHDVHVVVTVRDLARTIPSAWQQSVQAGRSYRYDEFLEAVLSDGQTGPAVSFWRNHGVLDLVKRWSRLTTPSCTHLVIVPPPGAPPEVLLDRFCSVIGVDTAGLVRDAARSNESLGLAQVEVLRRLNEIPRDMDPKLRSKVYKLEFAGAVLAAQPGRRPLMPATSRSWCHAYAEQVGLAITTGGYDVVGDLADLDPPESAFTDAPQMVSESELAAAAIVAVGALLAQRASEVERTRAARSRGSPP